MKVEKLTEARVQKRKFSFLFAGAVMLTGLGALSVPAFSASGRVELLPPASERDVASLVFPRYRETGDTEDVLREYPAYLNFVLEVGRDVNPTMAKRLAYTYQQLRRRSPEGAARFLRGLRFEMVYRLELTGTPTTAVTTRTPAMRHWVNQYIKDWWQEADEGLFRALVRR